MQKLIVLLGLVAVCTALPAEPIAKFVDYEVYKVESRLYPDGVLTVKTNALNVTDLPTVRAWADDAGQKWRLESSSLYTAFQLRPTSHESFVLEQNESDSFLKWVASIGNFGRHKLWYLNDAGNGFTQIKNKRYDTCLAAFGIDQPVNAVTCTNSPDQQWKVAKL